MIERMPVEIKTLREVQPRFRFYDPEEFDRLVLAAEHTGNPNVLLTVLLGGEAGLRCSEMRPLAWSDLELQRGLMTISKGMWRNHEGPPKGGRIRTVPLAPRLREALQQHRHLRSPHVLCTQRGTRPSASTVRRWLNQAQRGAGFQLTGPHVLRHTFCSTLALAARPAKVIQELAGHQSITTTERYMHLAPQAARSAISAFDRPPNWRQFGCARQSLGEEEDDELRSHHGNLTEGSSRLKSCPAKASRQPEASLAWFGGDPGCEA